MRISDWSSDVCSSDLASLSVPWGNTSDSSGGYHLVWTRDAVEAGLALLAVGRTDDARRMLGYVIATQQPDGGWSQNSFPDGDRKSTRLNSSHSCASRMPSSA